MVLKGLQKGDKKIRKFTFDDEEYIEKDGKYYYKVNYGKNSLEGEYAEDEIDYIEVTQVIPLGGKKLKPIPELQKPTAVAAPQEPQLQQVEKPKRGRPPKVTKLDPGTGTLPVKTVLEEGDVQFEYLVENVDIDEPKTLKDTLNSWGALGWELCWMESIRNIFGGTKATAIFKRKKRSI